MQRPLKCEKMVKRLSFIEKLLFYRNFARPIEKCIKAMLQFVKLLRREGFYY